MILFDYFRSSAAYRVRIALNLKGLSFEQRPVNLVKGEERAREYKTLNPQGLVPALVLDDGRVLTQSLAICEYLEESHPEPALLPMGSADRARVRALAQIIACDIHPLNNLRVLKYVTGILGVDDAAKLAWYQHWVADGLSAVEALLKNAGTGRCCHGNTPSVADVCLVPQVYNARRFDCDLTPYPTLVRIADHCAGLAAFAEAHPAQQPDAS